VNPTQATTKFSLAITSDPQYPWYDGVLPDNLPSDQVNENSNRQIIERYRSINEIARQRRDSNDQFKVSGILINGDLTAFGHDWQLEKYKDQIATIDPSLFLYPALGNHDYQNNVDDTFNNNAASRMVDYMYSWLKLNTARLNYDFQERSYYQFPELRTDYTGSLAYSFNIGKVHIVQLQNFPSYTDDWNSWNTGSARRDYYFIRPSFYWLKNDLAIARNRGDIIIVCLHDYHDDFVIDVDKFNNIIQEYAVSAVFAGHIHQDCRLIENIGNAGIPFFRSGSASYQDYLLADIDTDSRNMNVVKMSCPYDGNYTSGEQWPVSLKDPVPDPPLPVPPTQGRVTFMNDGGFEAQFRLIYKGENGQSVEENSGTMLNGNKKSYDIPPYATDVWIVGKENTGLVWEGWRIVFDLRFPGPPNNCFRLYNTTLNPKWDNNCS